MKKFLCDCSGFPDAPWRVAALWLTVTSMLASCSFAGDRITPPETPKQASAYTADDGPGSFPLPNLDLVPEPVPRVEPLHPFANAPYSMLGHDYVPMRELSPQVQRGRGTWYGKRFHGQRTASGEVFDMYRFTAAHPTFPIPSYARVTHIGNGRTVIVKINDRGAYGPGQLIEVSWLAANKLGFSGRSDANLVVELVLPEEIERIEVRERAIQEAMAKIPAAPAPLPVIASQVPETPAPPPAPMPIAETPTGIFLQLGAFSSAENARVSRIRLQKQLPWLNYPVEVVFSQNLHRVRVGPYRNRTDAQRAAELVRDAINLRPLMIEK